MTPRRRWLALLAGRGADRIPTDYQATPEVTERLLGELACPDEEALYARLRIDARRFVEPRWKLPHYPGDPEADMWGVRYRWVDYGAGRYQEPVYHPLAAAETPADVHAHRWPSPDDFDYAAVAEAVRTDDGTRPLHAGHYEPLMIYGYMRGLQQALEDLMLRPAIADAVLGHLLDFYWEHHRRIFAAAGGRIDTTWVAEDLGAQTGPLMSLGTYRRFLLPGQIKMAELARSCGVHVMYHTDGAAAVFLPDLVDRVGIEVLNPIQWRCPGMECERLVAQFGDRLVFHGAIDNQQTLAFGSPADVEAEVRRLAEIFAGARWICAPCHNIQPITPTENIVTLYETIDRLSA